MEDDDDDIEEHKTQAFERQYLDERSWENLVEKDGRLVSTKAATVHRKRTRADALDSRIRRGMIRSIAQIPHQLISLQMLLKSNRDTLRDIPPCGTQA